MSNAVEELISVNQNVNCSVVNINFIVIVIKHVTDCVHLSGLTLPLIPTAQSLIITLNCRLMLVETACLIDINFLTYTCMYNH